jgi:hypothetical protein
MLLLLVAFAAGTVGYTAPIATLDFPSVPDNELILRDISDPASPLYHPFLMARDLDGDTVLTAREYECLYYGYVWQDDYRPLESPPESTYRLFELFAANIEPNATECDDLIATGEAAIKVDPFNMQLINILTFVYGRVGDKKNERINCLRLRNIINTIQSSGTGRSESSPWHVLYANNSVDLLGAMGLHHGKRLFASRTVEYISLAVKNGKIRGYYFDFGRMYWKKPERQLERPRGMEINGIKIR